MAQNEMRDQEWDDLSPEAVRRMWEEMQARDDGTERICMNCANMVWPQPLEDSSGSFPWRVRHPVCPCHADSPGVPREVDIGGGCPNFRPKPRPPLRVEPPEPERPTDRHIPLTRGLWAIVGEQDYERLSKHRWYASPGRGDMMYARRNTRRGTVSMHREIMNPPEGMLVDHKNHNGVDNHPENLRVCTPAQNQYNRRPQGRKSQYKGVYPAGDKWQAMVKHKGHAHYLGLYDDDVEAAKVRDRKAYELQGEFAYLNFPEDFPRREKPREAAST
jgi:hypothetical protein